MSRYEIKLAVCNECHEEYIETEFRNVESQHPEWDREKGQPVPKQYQEEWLKAYHAVPETMCFVFEADCHGDAIALCKKHLQSAIAHTGIGSGEKMIRLKLVDTNEAITEEQRAFYKRIVEIVRKRSVFWDNYVKSHRYALARVYDAMCGWLAGAYPEEFQLDI